MGLISNIAPKYCQMNRSIRKNLNIFLLLYLAKFEEAFTELTNDSDYKAA